MRPGMNVTPFLCLVLRTDNCQKWKSRFFTCPCHRIYRVEAVGLPLSNYTFNTQLPKLLFTPVCAQEGGSTWTHPFLSTFPWEFWYETCTISVYTWNNHKLAKRTLKKCCVSKWWPKNKYVTWSREISRMSEILILSYRLKEVMNFYALHCFWSWRIAHISGTRCLIEIGFGSKCSLLNGQVIYIEKSNWKLPTYDSFPLIVSHFCFVKIVTWPKFEKPLSQWIFFNEIRLKVGEHEHDEYIYIFAIKFEKIILFKNGGKNKFCDIAQ